MSQVSTIGFICEAFGQNQKIYKDIDLVYQKRKHEFFKLAKADELYNHPIITGGSLLQEEYSKKMLGIILYQHINADSEDIIRDIDNLVKKGWPYVYTFLNFSEISMDKFLKRYSKKKGGLEDLTDDEINANLIILLSIASSKGKTVIRDDFFDYFKQYLYERLEHYKPENRIEIEKIPLEDKKNIEKLKLMIFKKVGKIIDCTTFLEYLIDDKLCRDIDLLFEYEYISQSIFNSVKFTSKDVDEIILLYYANHRDIDKIDIDDAIRFYLYSMYIRYMIKCYKQVKTHYFENNMETQLVELEAKEKEIVHLTSKLEQKEKNEINLLNEINELTKKVDKMTIEIEAEKFKDNELNSLREFMFSLDSKIEYEGIDINFEKLEKVKAVILGGHEHWQATMKKYLPGCIFIHTDMINYDLNVLNKINDIFIYANYLNHEIYYKTMEYIRNKNKSVHYLNHQNEKIVLMEIQKKMMI